MKIFLDVVGCRLNQSEVESFANAFRALGHQIVGDPCDADLAIVNTCAVTVKAAADSRKKLRRAAREGAPAVLATGCWATLYPDAASELEGVTGVIVNDEKEQLVSKVLGLNPQDVSQLQMIREPLPGDRARTRAFIRVQEGCDNHCTYCLTRIARGNSRSRQLRDVEKDIRAAIAGEAREVVLTGVQLGAWGRDFDEPRKLSDLIEGVLAIPGFDRLRLSSIEPWDFEPAMLDLWQSDRLCRHLHIPLQSGNDRVLKAMGRPITPQGYLSLVEAIRNRIPEIAITTDVIVGFPGETQEEFESTRRFIEEISFSGGHVFTYSPRPGTAAYKMEPRVLVAEAKARNAELRHLFNQTGFDYRSRFIGQTLPVLWESAEKQADDAWRLSGLTDNYLRVFAGATQDLWNHMTLVLIEGHHPDRGALTGKIIESSVSILI